MVEWLFTARKPAPVVFGTGLIALDVVFGRDNIRRVWAGGSCGNVLTILRYLGWQSYPIANLKNDEAARIICDDLSYWGVNTDLVVCSENGRTPIIVEKIGNNGGHKFMFKCPYSGLSLPKYKPIDVKHAKNVISQMGDKPSVFYFDRVSKATIELAKEFTKRGAVIVFEPSTIKNKKLFQEALGLCHILKYSSQQLSKLRKIGSRPIPILEIETLGSKGLRYRVKIDSKSSEWKFMESYKLGPIKDTAGAGDWCTAGILQTLCQNGMVGFRELLTSQYLEFGLKFGQALAAFNCMFEGARGSMYFVSKDYLLDIIHKIMADGTSNAPRSSLEYFIDYFRKNENKVGKFVLNENYKDLLVLASPWQDL
ncbi:carbohydrate kinase [Archaeoglobales archaeon]|nr:MAG: carbohydrate kinase [Archaeoglobales archaeon]